MTQTVHTASPRPRGDQPCCAHGTNGCDMDLAGILSVFCCCAVKKKKWVHEILILGSLVMSNGSTYRSEKENPRGTGHGI